MVTYECNLDTKVKVKEHATNSNGRCGHHLRRNQEYGVPFRKNFKSEISRGGDITDLTLLTINGVASTVIAVEANTGQFRSIKKLSLDQN